MTVEESAKKKKTAQIGSSINLIVDARCTLKSYPLPLALMIMFLDLSFAFS